MSSGTTTVLVRNDGAFGVNANSVATSSLSDFESQEDSILLPGETPYSVELAERLSKKNFIAISFSKFADGRGYSWAKNLRDRFGFQGTLRATGDILVDQLLYYSRVGFDELELSEGQKVESALRALGRYKEFYQPAAGETSQEST